MESNRTMGNSFEAEFCKKLSECGWWVHNMAQNQSGQPADVLAVKNSKAMLIDCKVCSNAKGFDLNRIEPNQEYAMKKWQDCGNSFAWFSIKRNDGEVFMITFNALKDMATIKSSLTNQEIEGYGIKLNKWLKMMPL